MNTFFLWAVSVAFFTWAVYRLSEAIATNRTGSQKIDNNEAAHISQIAATLIGAAMNNPQYVARMAEIRGQIKHLSDIKPHGINVPEEDREKVDRERKAIDERIRDLEYQSSVSDLFGSGRRPYIDLAFEVYRDVQELRRKDTTFSSLDYDRIINSKDTETAEKIDRADRLRKFARP